MPAKCNDIHWWTPGEIICEWYKSHVHQWFRTGAFSKTSSASSCIFFLQEMFISVCVLANKSRNLGSTRFLKRFLHWSGPVVSVFLHLHNHVGLTLKSSMAHTIAAKTESTASNFPRNKSLKGADVETLDPSHVQNVWSWAWHFVFLWRGHAEKFKPVSETAQGCQAKNWALLNSRHSQALYLNFPFLELDLISKPCTLLLELEIRRLGDTLFLAHLQETATIHLASTKGTDVNLMQTHRRPFASNGQRFALLPRPVKASKS